MHTKPLRERSTPTDALTSLETLRPRLTDLEAVAHAAEQTLGELPYLQTDDEEVRRNVGRLHSLVSATASTARDVLDEHAEMLARAYEDEELALGDDDDDPEDPDSGPDDSAPGGGKPEPPAGPASGPTSAAGVNEGVHPIPRSRSGGVILDTNIYPCPVR